MLTDTGRGIAACGAITVPPWVEKFSTLVLRVLSQQMVSRPPYRERALTYLQIKQMPANGEVGPQPAKHAGHGQHHRGVPVRQESEPKIRTVGRGERRDLTV